MNIFLHRKKASIPIDTARKMHVEVVDFFAMRWDINILVHPKYCVEQSRAATLRANYKKVRQSHWGPEINAYDASIEDRRSRRCQAWQKWVQRFALPPGWNTV